MLSLRCPVQLILLYSSSIVKKGNILVSHLKMTAYYHFQRTHNDVPSLTNQQGSEESIAHLVSHSTTNQRPETLSTVSIRNRIQCDGKKIMQNYLCTHVSRKEDIFRRRFRHHAILILYHAKFKTISSYLMHHISHIMNQASCIMHLHS